MKRMLFPLVMIVLSLLVVLSGCTTGASGSKDQSAGSGAGKNAGDSGEKVLLLNNGEEPTSLDPPIGFDSVSYNILNNTMEGLTRLGKDNQPHPAIASEWDVSKNGKVYTFKLRKDAKWSNGDPVTAQDFEYAWKRLANPETAAAPAFLSYIIKGAEAYNTGKGSADDMMVKAVDDHTLKVTLAYPQSYFLSVISNPCFFPVNKKVVENNPKWASDADTLVTNGPFTITKWEHDNQIVMKKNPNYWDADTVKLDKVIWKMINDPNTEYQMYKTDELHTSDVPSDLSEQLFKSGKVKVAKQAGTYFYRFNTNMKPFDNQKIRKAFSLAINRENIVKYITKNKE
ncbi:MAG TPA: peptide ABC transporter substrate-binding protein, partial [Bacillales bacterium]|nr:peptide ABC transporter substrate-binding protein [Bacillales bacterium]